MGNPVELKAQQRATEAAREAEAAEREVQQVRDAWKAHKEAMRRHHGPEHVTVYIAQKNCEQAVQLTRIRREVEFALRRAREDSDAAEVERLRAELDALPPRPMPPAQPSSRKYYT
ncbi:MAG: hypothetical protein M5U25_01975 [Planctomycetota bacterium]|nr:hypothetical protein [Planctomycetota bacterium]